MKSRILFLVAGATLVACGSSPIQDLETATESDSSEVELDEDDPAIPDAGGQLESEDGELGAGEPSELLLMIEHGDDAGFEYGGPRMLPTAPPGGRADSPIEELQITEFGRFVARGRDGDNDGNTPETVSDCVLSSGASCADAGGTWACFRNSWSRKVYCECDTGG